LYYEDSETVKVLYSTLAILLDKKQLCHCKQKFTSNSRLSDSQRHSEHPNALTHIYCWHHIFDPHNNIMILYSNNPRILLLFLLFVAFCSIDFTIQQSPHTTNLIASTRLRPCWHPAHVETVILPAKTYLYVSCTEKRAMKTPGESSTKSPCCVSFFSFHTSHCICLGRSVVRTVISSSVAISTPVWAVVADRFLNHTLAWKRRNGELPSHYQHPKRRLRNKTTRRTA
jgi:hypothetical protein